MARKAADQVATIGIDVVCKNSSNVRFGSEPDVQQTRAGYPLIANFSNTVHLSLGSGPSGRRALSWCAGGLG